MTTPIIMRFDVQDDGSVKVATINSNLAQLENGLNRASSQSSYFTRAMGFVKTALSSIQSVIFSVQGALAGLGIALTAASFIKTASDMETLRVRMQLLTGSVSEGNKMFDMAAGYAEKVTYEYLDIMNAAVLLRSALNTSNEETMRLVQIAGDLAARSGLPIQEAAAQLVRMWAAGAASAEQFRERGILAMLGFKAGVQYSVEDTRRKLIEAWEDPSKRIKGSAEGLGTTFKGVLSMLSDEWTKFQLTLMEGGLFESLKKSLNDLRESFGSWMKNNKDQVAGWGKSLGDGFQSAVEAAKELGKNIGLVKAALDALILAVKVLIALKAAVWLISFADAAKGAILWITGLIASTEGLTLANIQLSAAILLSGKSWKMFELTLKTTAVAAIILGTVEAILYLRRHSEITAQVWANIWFGALIIIEKFKTGTMDLIMALVTYIKVKFYDTVDEIVNLWNGLQAQFNKVLPDKYKFTVTTQITNTAQMKADNDAATKQRDTSSQYYIDELIRQREEMKNQAWNAVTESSVENPVVRAAKDANAQAAGTKVQADAATDALKRWKGELAQIEAQYQSLRASQRIAEEIDQRRQKLTSSVTIGGTQYDPLSDIDALNQRYDRERALLDLESQRVVKELQVEQAATGQEQDQNRIAKLIADQKSIEEERLKLPVLQQLDQRILKQDQINRMNQAGFEAQTAHLDAAWSIYDKISSAQIDLMPEDTLDEVIKKQDAITEKLKVQLGIEKQKLDIALGSAQSELAGLGDSKTDEAMARRKTLQGQINDLEAQENAFAEYRSTTLAAQELKNREAALTAWERYIKQLKKDTDDLSTILVSTAEATASAFAQFLDDIRTGAKTAKQAWMDFITGIQNAFYKAAEEMLAKKAMLGILNLVGAGEDGKSLLGVGGGASAVATTANTTALTANTTALGALTATIGGSSATGAVSGVANAASGAWQTAETGILSSMKSMFSGLTSTIGSGLSSFGNMVMSGLGSIGGGLSSLGGMLMNGLSGLLGGLGSMGGMAMSGLSGAGGWAMTGLSALAMFLATGGVFAHGAMIPFARGGAFTNAIVNRPTIFPMASGSIGLMGEAGPEAVMPLTRMSNGKLGVSIADFAPMPSARAADSKPAGSSMVVNIYNESGNQVERKEYTHSDGTRELMIRIKREVQDDIMRGGQIGRAIEATYGSQRSTVKR